MNEQLTIVIPVRNEEQTITQTIESLHTLVKTPHVILIVDDSIDETDTTIARVESISKKIHPIKISYKKRGLDQNGFAYAIKRGIFEVDTPYVIFVMADACDDPKTIDIMFDNMKQQQRTTVICGSRYMKGGKKIGGPIVQGVCSTIVNTLLHFVFGVPTTDASNSYKMYSTNFIRTLHFSNVSSFEISLYLLLQAFVKHVQIIDVPTVWKGRTVGFSKFNIINETPRYMRVIINSLFITDKKKILL
jgi:dolichol-phosphate mannosyltransferase